MVLQSVTDSRGGADMRRASNRLSQALRVRPSGGFGLCCKRPTPTILRIMTAERGRRDQPANNHGRQAELDQREVTLAEGEAQLAQREELLLQREQAVARRERAADERERLADGREATADEREEIADQRERAADEREEQAVARREARPTNARHGSTRWSGDWTSGPAQRVWWSRRSRSGRARPSSGDVPG